MKQIKNIEINYDNSEIDYIDSLNFMEERVVKIKSKKQQELIWFLNHKSIYTLGTSGNIKDIRKETNIPLLKTNRGGQITYHGPGQRIIYLLIDLEKRRKDIRKFVNLIENSVIKFLNEFNIESRTFENRVGIWVTKNKGVKLEKEQKIGAIGLRIKKWVTYHGLSFNINPDLNYYKNINACGLKEYSSTSMKNLGINISVNEFDELFLKFFLSGLKDL